MPSFFLKALSFLSETTIDSRGKLEDLICGSRTTQKDSLGGFLMPGFGIKQMHQEWLNPPLDKCVTKHFAKFTDLISVQGR